MGKTVKFTCKICLKHVKFKPKKLAITYPTYVNDCINNKVEECCHCYVLTPSEKTELTRDRQNQIMHDKTYCQSQYTYHSPYLYVDMCNLM